MLFSLENYQQDNTIRNETMLNIALAETVALHVDYVVTADF